MDHMNRLLKDRDRHIFVPCLLWCLGKKSKYIFPYYKSEILTISICINNMLFRVFTNNNVEA